MAGKAANSMPMKRARGRLSEIFTINYAAILRRATILEMQLKCHKISEII